MKKMTEEQIPLFVEAVLSTGCCITAVGEANYVLGDADLPEPRCFDVQSELMQISEYFGERDHLLLEIVRYLHSVGRSYPLDDQI